MTPWLAPVRVEKRFPLPFLGSTEIISRPSPAAHAGVQPPKHSISEEGPCGDQGSLHSLAMTPSLGTLGVQEDGDGVTPHKCSVFASRGCRRRAELMALLCRAGLIFWEEGGQRERDRPRKRQRKLPLLNFRLCSERGSWEMGRGHADLPQGFPQPLTMSMLRGAPAESLVGLPGLREIIPMGPDLGFKISGCCGDWWLLCLDWFLEHLNPCSPHSRSSNCFSGPLSTNCLLFHVISISMELSQIMAFFILVFIWGGGR